MAKTTYSGNELATVLNTLVEDVALIKNHLVNSDTKRARDYLTVLEWCEEAKCSRWVFEMLKSHDLIPYKRVGRKIIIPAYTVVQYLEGEIKLPPINKT